MLIYTRPTSWTRQSQLDLPDNTEWHIEFGLAFKLQHTHCPLPGVRRNTSLQRRCLKADGPSAAVETLKSLCRRVLVETHFKRNDTLVDSNALLNRPYTWNTIRNCVLVHRVTCPQQISVKKQTSLTSHSSSCVYFSMTSQSWFVFRR